MVHKRFEAVGYDRLEALMPAIKERAKTLHDLLDNARFLIAERPLTYDAKAIQWHTDEPASSFVRFGVDSLIQTELHGDAAPVGGDPGLAQASPGRENQCRNRTVFRTPGIRGIL